MLLEVCIDDEAGALRALEAGAARLEVCSRLDLGGLTPTDELARACRAATQRPLMAMVRPRGGDSVYDAAEIELMRGDLARMQRLDLDGVVLGALTARGEIDVEVVRELVALARPLAVTFHRAFDHVRDPLRALDVLASLGIERVLTSGGAADAFVGRAALRTLVDHAGERLVVLAGGGVRAHNAREIVAASGVVELHSSTPFDLRAAGLGA